ncbi:glutamate 5-kinase [Erysipelothrix urinaevulpis]|uniref:glutamate 5-kinase n=1 Tax=Erysipelothrix urinaevulpis TaxID=2683717 RepID=UPI001356F08D|nr:glutamate 5-kinase [Erysipelothrix urinaevulpis]
MRNSMINAKRIVVKIGSSSLTHKESGDLDYRKLEQLVRVLSDLKSKGKEIILVSSGAQAVGRKALNLQSIPVEMPKKQALAAIGQAKLMMTYQRLFSEYNQTVAQVLLTKHTMFKEESRMNAKNTFNELLAMGVIPIVNENDTVATHEIEFGDNDHLSAYVLAMVEAELLIILSDIDGFYTDDPSENPDAKLIEYVEKISNDHRLMGKETSSSSVGTGGMSAKIEAGIIVNNYGADMILASGNNLDILYDIIEGKNVGTFFKGHANESFDIDDYL